MAELTVVGAADIETTVLNVSGGSGTFTVHEVLDFGTSGARALFESESGGKLTCHVLSGLPSPVETITGVDSAATRQLDSIDYDALTLLTPAAAGDTFENDGRTALLVWNASGSPVSIRIVAARAGSDGRLNDWVKLLSPASFDRLGWFQPERFNSAGKVTFVFSSITGIGVAPIRFPRQENRR